MDYLQTLGQILREIRVAQGLSREDCSDILNRDHLAKIEQGRLALTVVKFRSLSEFLGISQSLVLFAVEARLSGQNLDEYLAHSDLQLKQHIATGKLSSAVYQDAFRGVRGKRAADTREAILKLQADAVPKYMVVRKLGVSRSTVDRYWKK
ncbi:Fis family transcriptional regulator [Pseudomonas palleroniana]|uniref:helix-turn-helix domain-containing protein n=1 Tax=Pseudomonas palleroniana TaxID=191390 RepID=UPI003AFF62CB